MKPLKIYMDVCCYNRPMDDQSQLRVYIESETIQGILLKCDAGLWTLVGSEVLAFEINNNTQDENRQKALSMMKGHSKEIVLITDEIQVRAESFQKHNIKAFDSLHLACAESANVDVLLSVDDKFIKAAKRTDSKVRVINPTDWIKEVFSNG